MLSIEPAEYSPLRLSIAHRDFGAIAKIPQKWDMHCAIPYKN